MTPFDAPGKHALLKTLWEKKKMLVTSIFFFSHNVFYPMKDNFHVLNNIKFVVCKCFNLSKPKILSSGKGLYRLFAFYRWPLRKLHTIMLKTALKIYINQKDPLLANISLSLPQISTIQSRCIAILFPMLARFAMMAIMMITAYERVSIPLSGHTSSISCLYFTTKNTTVAHTTTARFWMISETLAAEI